MPTLRSGLVIAGGYADKVRRVLFAQMKDKIKSGEVDAREVARAAGELNRLLFEILVNRLGVDKGDVVRIIVDYDFEDGTIKWNLDTLQVQVWRRVPDEEVAEKVKSVAESAEEILEVSPQFELEKLGETDTGDIVYKILLDGEEVGAILATPLNGQAVVRAAFLSPTPKVLKRQIIDLENGIDETLEQVVGRLYTLAEDTEKRQASRTYREIMAMIEAEAGEEEVEEEE